MLDRPTNCPDCSVRPGQLHRHGCDVARCAESGLQRLGCSHTRSACNTRWSGHWPGDAECWEYGFLIHPSPEGKAAGFPPLPDLNRLYTECDWDPEQQRMVLSTAHTAAVMEGCP
ncbi:hypothetical protein [Streptomyces sp. NBC_01601]|uniref:hypothetical protein n=1 Tax=Streptomyces sp. NBC_01601 TaxID=2975892 RepID=UPI002E2CC31E|nr:hypothetical protein [Streptomyces sp. NBC_01601]